MPTHHLEWRLSFSFVHAVSASEVWSAAATLRWAKGQRLFSSGGGRKGFRLEICSCFRSAFLRVRKVEEARGIACLTGSALNLESLRFCLGSMDCRQAGTEDLTQEKVLRFAAEHENASLALIVGTFSSPDVPHDIVHRECFRLQCIRQELGLVAVARRVPSSRGLV